MADKQGYRATVQSLKAAETMDDLWRMERLSDRFGSAYRAALRFVLKTGGFSICLAAMPAALGWQAVVAALWAWRWARRKIAPDPVPSPT